MIKNISKKTVLSDKFQLCESLFSKAIGLMFSLKPKTLIFKWDKNVKANIHMLFVFFPIDIIWLDKDKRVLTSKKSLKPFIGLKIGPPNTRFIIELKKGSIERSKTNSGDVLYF